MNISSTNIKLPARTLALLLLVLQSLVAGAMTDSERMLIAPDYQRLKNFANEKSSVRVLAFYKQPAHSRGNPAVIRALRDRLLETMASRGIRPLKAFDRFPIAVFSLGPLELDALIDSGLLERVNEDRLNSPSLLQSTALIGSSVAHSYGVIGSGAAIAVLDVGIDNQHPAFAGRLLEEACFSTDYVPQLATNLCPNGTEVIEKPNNPDFAEYYQYGVGAAGLDKCEGKCSHGTHVASIAAGNDTSITGVAPGAGIIAVQVFSKFNDTAACGSDGVPCVRAFDSSVLSGLDYVASLAATYNIAAVNLSLGGGQYTAACDASSNYTEAIDQLDSLGITVVAASGNNSYKNAINSPACVSKAFSVGSVTDTTDVVSSWSNAASMLDILAPGAGIRAALPNGAYGNKSGTSMAAPHVAGAVALLKSYNSALSVAEIKNILLSHSVTVIDSRSGSDIAFPRLDIAQAIQSQAQPADLPVIQPGFPANNAVLDSLNNPFLLLATASDQQDGDLSSAVSWRSDIDGQLSSPASLSLGLHQLTATVTDSTGFVVSETLSITVANFPSLQITEPANAKSFLSSQVVQLAGIASDVEDGNLNADIRWFSSEQGDLGSGADVNIELIPAIHTISALIQDSDGNETTAVSPFNITVDADLDRDGMADEWELFYGLGDPSADPDNDSLDNLAEFKGASNPLDAAPEVIILSPLEGFAVKSGDTIVLNALANDVEDGDISPQLSWQSDLDGELGTGTWLLVILSPGAHQLSASVQDSQGALPVVAATVGVFVTAAGDINADGVVGIGDLLLLQSHLLGVSLLDSEARMLADTYPEGAGDGVLTISDLLTLQQQIMLLP